MGHRPRGLLARDGTAWDYFPHDHARSRAYRWGEDGLLGISDNHQRLCFALALWNGRDPILKERLFGLTGPEGNHGEDVKEYYFYLDATPTHSYMRALYKYPQREYPYARLVEENARRGRDAARVRAPRHRRLRRRPLLRRRSWSTRRRRPNDILIRVTVDEPRARRRRRSTCCRRSGSGTRGPGSRTRGSRACVRDEAPAGAAVVARGAPGALAGLPPLRRGDAAARSSPRTRPTPGACSATASPTPGGRTPSTSAIVHGREELLLPDEEGTKVAAQHRLDDSGGRPDGPAAPARRRRCRRRPSGRSSTAIFAERQREADEFYATVVPERLGEDARRVMRQALAGMLWSKQWYHYDVRRWLEGDPGQPPPPPERRHGRNAEWTHLYNDDVVSMPDKWEYPVVRGVGPRVPHDRARAGRSRLREGPARPVPARVVHAPERPDSRLRVGVRRREPAGPRLGGLARLQDREAHPGRRRPPVPRARLPEAPPELHLVGEPQGPRGEERLPGRLPRPRQHRRLRPLGAAARRAATSSSPTARPGSGCTA